MSSQNSTLEMISWNVNGLRACRKKTFDEFVAKKNPDLLCLQEVKLNSEVIPEDDFGYPYRHYHLAEKKGTRERRFFPKLNRFQFVKISQMVNMWAKEEQ